GHRPAIVAPGCTADRVVVVAQGVEANFISGVGADEAVGFRDDAANADRSAAPGHRPTVGVPGGTSDQVVTVSGGYDLIGAHLIIGGGADETIGGIEDAADPGGAAGPGHRPTVTVPARADDQIVAIAQSPAGAHPVTGVVSDEGADQGPRQPIKQI